MASIITNSISITSVQRPQFPNGDLNPSLLLSPANLQLNPRWDDGQVDNIQGSSYLLNQTPTSVKSEKTSLTDRLKKVFRKKDKNSPWSDKSLKISSSKDKRYSETYFPNSKDVARPTSNKGHRYSEIYYPTSNNNAFKSPNQNNGAVSPNYNQEIKTTPNFGKQQTTPTGPSPISSTEKKNTNFLDLLKSPMKIFAMKKNKNLHRDRYLSECPMNGSEEKCNTTTTQVNEKYFHYNTVNADDYKEIFNKDAKKTPLEVPSYIVTITPGSQMINNLRQKLPLSSTTKKSRFTVSSASIEKHSPNDGTRQMTLMAQHLKKTDDNHGYNTVGPQDNRDRRPSVSLHDFLEMYKEKNLSGSEKMKIERRRSVSQSDSQTSHTGQLKNIKPQTPLETPAITITTTKNEIDKTTDLCAQQIAVENIPTGSHSIPEHQEVHHESQAGIGNFIQSGKATRKNRFLNRGAVTKSDSKILKNSSHSRHASTDGCVGTPKVVLLPAYDHSLTVSGYPRKLAARKRTLRRMSEPDSSNQKWPELKNNTTPGSDEPQVTTTPQYRKVPANSLGIDIPTDEFHNKLLVWIDKKRGTKILPLPQAGHEVWSGSKDENSSICYLAKRYKCYNVMPTSGKLVLFDSELPVTSAFEAFTFNRVRSAPIWDSKKKQLTGMLTVSDFIDVLLICSAQPELFEKISEQKISDWKSLSNKAKYEASKIYDNIASEESKDQGINNDALDWSLSDDVTAPSDLESSNNGEADTNDQRVVACNPNTDDVGSTVEENQNDVEKCDGEEMPGYLSDLNCCDEITTQTLSSNDSSSATTTTNNDLTGISTAEGTSCTPPSPNPIPGDTSGPHPTTVPIPPTTPINSSPLRVVRSSSCDPETGSVSFETGLISVESDDTIYDAISVLKTFKFHRVLVMDYSDNDPLYILTYKRILYFIYVMMDTIDIPPFMDITIKDLNVGTFTNLVTIKYDTTLREALALLQCKCVSAIPVLDCDDKVVDLYTKEDVMNLVYNNKFTQLNSTIEEILHDKRRIFEGLFECKETDSLMAVVQYFISSKAHRLVVTTDDNQLLGIISLSDVVNFMVLGCGHDDDITDVD